MKPRNDIPIGYDREPKKHLNFEKINRFPTRGRYKSETQEIGLENENITKTVLTF